MKITLQNTPLKVLALTAAVLTAGTASAVTLGVGLDDPYMLGTVINGIQAGGQAARDVTMTNNLLTVGLGLQATIPTVGGELYSRSSNVFSPLPAAVETGNVLATGAGLSFSTSLVSLTLTSQFQYLVAAWDGPNGGVAIYDIASVASGTQINLLRYAQPNNGVLVDGTSESQYQMTGWTLLNPINNRGDSVPDSGSVLILSGIAMVALGLGRRFV